MHLKSRSVTSSCHSCPIPDITNHSLPTGEAEKGKPGQAIYNSQPTATTRTLIDILDDSIKVHPRHLAVDNGQTRLTYHQLQEEIATRLATLRASHIGAGDRVGSSLT